MERIRRENEQLRSQILGAEGDGAQAAVGSQKLDVASIAGLNFPAGGSALTQDPLLLSNALSSIELLNSNSARAHLLAGQLPDQLRQQYLGLQQIAGAASAPVSTQDQMMGVLALLSQMAPNSNANLTRFGDSFPSVIRNQPYQPQAQVDPAQIQHLLELLRQSNDGNIR